MNINTRVCKWPVTLNGGEQEIGAGKVVLVAVQGGLIHVWTEERFVEGELYGTARRRVAVYGTGHNLPQPSVHLGSVLMDRFVWHVYETRRTF